MLVSLIVISRVDLDDYLINGKNVAIVNSKEMTSNRTYSKGVLIELSGEPRVPTIGVEVEPWAKVKG